MLPQGTGLTNGLCMLHIILCQLYGAAFPDNFDHSCLTAAKLESSAPHRAKMVVLLSLTLPVLVMHNDLTSNNTVPSETNC